MAILLISPEAFPYCKPGGLADAVYGLARQLYKQGEDVRIILPSYRETLDPNVQRANPELLERMERVVADLSVPLWTYSRQAEIWKARYQEIPYYLVKNEFYFERENQYGYVDDYERFIFFSRSVLQMLIHPDFQQAESGWFPEILQGYNGVCGLIPAWLPKYEACEPRFEKCRFIYALHNLNFVGRYNIRALQAAMQEPSGVYPDFEAPGDINFMGRGLMNADRVVVSDRCLVELEQLPAGARPLQPLLAARLQDGGLVDIPTGIDYGQYNPDKDPHLEHAFSNENPTERVQNKLELQRELGFEVGRDIPLLGIVSPIREERGSRLLESLKDTVLKDGQVQLIILADEQDNRYDARIQDWLEERRQAGWDGKQPWMDLILGFDVALSRRIYAACDITLLPFRYMPGGTQQAIAMHYGAVPVAHATGVLRRAVVNYTPDLDLQSLKHMARGLGFTFDEYTSQAFGRAVAAALEQFKDRRAWARIQRHNMVEDFSWEVLADRYLGLYQAALDGPRRPLAAGEPLQLVRDAQLLQAIMEIDGLPGMQQRDARHMLKQAARLVRWVTGSDSVYMWILTENLPASRPDEPRLERILTLSNGQEVELVSSQAFHGADDPTEAQQVAALLFEHAELDLKEQTGAGSGGLCHPIYGLEPHRPLAQAKGWQAGRSVSIAAHSRLLGRIDVLFTGPLPAADEAWFDAALTTLASAFGLRLETMRYAQEKDEAVHLGQELFSAHSFGEVLRMILAQSKSLVQADEAWVFVLENGQLSAAEGSDPPEAVWEVLRLAQPHKGSFYIRDWAIALNGQRRATEMRSFLAVPLAGDDGQQAAPVVGWVVVAARVPGAFTLNQEHSLAHTLAPLATACLQTTLWHRDIEQQRLGKLTTLADSLVGGVEFKQLLSQSIDAFARALHAKGASLYLVDEKAPNILSIRAATGYHTDLLKANSVFYDLGVTGRPGVTGYIAIHGQALKFDSQQQMDGHEAWLGKFLSLQNNKQPESFMGFPLKVLDSQDQQVKTIGVLKLEDRQLEPGVPLKFTEEDFHLGEMMANMLATVVHNFRLSEARLQDLNDNLQQLSTAMSGGLEQNKLFQEIVNSIARIMRADAASLYLLDPDGHTLRIRAASGYQEGLLTRGKTYEITGKGVTAWIASTGQPFNAPSLAVLKSHPAWAGANNDAQAGREPNAFLGIPLIVKQEGDLLQAQEAEGGSAPAAALQQVIGVLKVEDIKEGPGHPEKYFTSQDEVLVRMMGSAIASVIQNTRLSEARLQELNSNLQQLSTAMSGGLEQNSLFGSIVDTIAKIMRADAASLYLLDPDGHTLRIRAANGYQADLLAKGKTYEITGKGVTAWIASTGQPFNARSLEILKSHPVWAGANNDAQGGREPNAFLGIPLMVGEGEKREVIGVLKVEDIKEGPGHPEKYFTSQDEVLVQMMGSAIAAVIQNTRLSDARLQELNNNLQRLSTAMTGSLEQSILVQRIVDTIAKIMRAEAASLYLLDPDGQTLRIRAANGYQEGLLTSGKTYNLAGRGITAWIASKGKPFNAPSLKALQSHEAWAGANNAAQGGREPNAFLGIPLKVGEGEKQEVIGVLKVENIMQGPGHPEKYFTDQDEVLVEMMGKIIAAIIQNTRQGDERLVKVLTDALRGGLPLRDGSQVLQTWGSLLASRDRVVYESFASAFFGALQPLDYEGLGEQTRLLLQADPRLELLRVLSRQSPSEIAQRWFEALLRYEPVLDVNNEKIVDALLLERDWLKAQNATAQEAGPAVETLAAAIIGASQAKITSQEQLDCWHIFQLENALPANISARLQVIPRRLPLLFYQGQDWRAERAENSIRDFLAKAHRFSLTRFALVVLLLPETQSGQMEREISRAFRAYSYDCLFLKLKDLQDLICSNDPQTLLLGQVLAVADLELISPYAGEGPTSTAMFCGREGQLREITNRIRLNSYCITGGRKVGKTSILMKLHNERLRAAGFRSLYFSMEKSPTYAEFLRQLPSSWQPEVPENAPQTMEELFARIGEFKDLVLLIDEIDKIVEDEEKHRWRLLHKLRSLCNEKQFHVVFTGENSINRIYDRGTGPLHNFTTRLPLPLLNDREVNELVTNPMKDLQIELEESDQIVETIQAFSWGHPAVVQYICRRLIRCANKKHRRNIKLSDVQGVLNDPDFQRSEFLQTFWEGSVPLERIISITMAGQPQAFTLEDVQKQLRERHRLDEPDHIVLDALDTLVDIRAILQRTSQGFEYAIPQFKQILMTQVQADGLLRSNLSEFRANKADPISGKPTPKP